MKFSARRRGSKNRRRSTRRRSTRRRSRIPEDTIKMIEFIRKNNRWRKLYPNRSSGRGGRKKYISPIKMITPIKLQKMMTPIKSQKMMTPVPVIVLKGHGKKQKVEIVPVVSAGRVLRTRPKKSYKE